MQNNDVLSEGLQVWSQMISLVKFIKKTTSHIYEIDNMHHKNVIEPIPWSPIIMCSYQEFKTTC